MRGWRAGIFIFTVHRSLSELTARMTSQLNRPHCLHKQLKEDKNVDVLKIQPNCDAVENKNKFGSAFCKLLLRLTLPLFSLGIHKAKLEIPEAAQQPRETLK